MKTQLLFASLLLLANGLFAQWEPIPVGSSSSDVTSMFTYVETLIVGTDGDGIFKTDDNGANWTDISGNLANKNVNDIRGGGGPTIIWVATDNGPFFTSDHINYENATSTGLTNTNINYYWFGDGNSSFAEWAIGTNGGGVFVSSELTGPWTASSNGMSGDGLIVNDISGYTDDEINFAVAATDDGVYFSTDTLVTWTQKNNGLTGDALKVKSIAMVGSLVLIVTHNGFYYSLDFGDNWTPIIPTGKFNDLLLQPSATGFALYAVGETVHYSNDFVNFYQLDISGISGEVTAVAQNSTHAFLGTSDAGKGGGVYKKPINQLITGVPDYTISKAKTVQLHSNYPNPFKGSTTLNFTLPVPGNVCLKIMDQAGREIKLLDFGYQTEGKHEFVFNADGLAEGIYFYTIQLENTDPVVGKMIIRK
ncbi:MAG: T9SS type A sorting domain-containing protein [Bacteroidales bacterium]|nr:T9SS type A sorting domain-containing protein [Bacteroidales bacterium]MCF8405276.1 T9SS type A sorting domain-containing protein [Bacteroidales bacterium]